MPSSPEHNPLADHAEPDEDENNIGKLHITLSESVDPTSTTGGTTVTGSSTGHSGLRQFNPHITAGGTVHASSKLTVGRNGISYGAGDARFRLDPNDFVPLRFSMGDGGHRPSPSASNDSATDQIPTKHPSSDAEPGTLTLTDSGETAAVSTGNLLGRGASGSVRLMVHLPTARPVAVKSIATAEKHHFDEILSELRALCDAKMLFETALLSRTTINASGAREASRLPPPPSPTSLSGPGFIVDFMGAWSTDGFVNIAMECMAGSLADIEPPSEPVLSRMTHMLLKGLSVMHHRLSLLHRDLKPGNVLFDAAGAVKVADFGVSSRLEPSKLEQTSTFIGSIMYMSPERVRGESYSYPSDIWALAITVAELFLGKHPLRLHAGDAAFHGNHERKFWKMVEIFGEAATFDRQIEGILAFCRPSPPAARVGPRPAGTTSGDMSELPLAALENVSAAPEYSAVCLKAREHGLDLADPRVPASAGLIARICAKSAKVSGSLAKFLARCLSTAQTRRSSVLELMGEAFIQEHCCPEGPEKDREMVSEWLRKFVPRASSSAALAQAARETAAAVKRGDQGSSPKLTPENSRAATNVSPVDTKQQQLPPTATKTAKVRAALSSLAAEPKPTSATVVTPPSGSVFSDDAQGSSPLQCCGWATAPSCSDKAPPASVQTSNTGAKS